MFRGRRLHVGVAAAVVLASLGSILVNPAAAAHVQCGQVITQSVKLDSDVGPCPGNGLIVVASGITVDLNGFRVFGVNGPDETAGIVLRRVSKVTLTSSVPGGTVQNFDAGVVVGGGSSNRILNLRVQENVGNSSDCNLGDGVALFGSNNNLISNNVVQLNGPLSGISIVGREATETDPSPPTSGNVVKDNQVLDNNIALPTCGNIQDIGIRVEGPNAVSNKVLANFVERSALHGIAIHSVNPPVSTDEDPEPEVVQLPNRQNEIANNIVLQNGLSGNPGSGIALAGFGPLSAPRPQANTVRQNTVVQNVEDGIQVDRGATDNQLLYNQGRGNLRYDGSDFNFEPPCDNNIWKKNVFVTVNQPCVANNGGSGTVPGPVPPADAVGAPLGGRDLPAVLG